MKLESFKEKSQKNIGMIIGIISVVLLLASIFVYRTYSIYQESQEFDVIKGSVPDQNYDTMYAFTLEYMDGNKITINTIPEGRDYKVEVDCTDGAQGFWDEETWGPIIKNLTTTRTKCYINFVRVPLKGYGIHDTLVENGNGLYEVPHEDAEITYTSDETAINNLKMTEYRYAGENPNNYVTFNGEEAGWRIIGLVNTPEGQRIKLIRDESIGSYSWDSSYPSVNYGYGINEWRQADIKTVLNSGIYYNRTSGQCYAGSSNATSNCDFSSNGLTEEAKEMIDTITWNTGAGSDNNIQAATSKDFYNYERSKDNGKVCSATTTHCNDTVTRTTSWVGQIGLMYPSDYGYATSGGDTTDRGACLSQALYTWKNSLFSDCKDNDWLYHSASNAWTLMPNAYTNSANMAIAVHESGTIHAPYVYNKNGVWPNIYIKQEIKIIDGTGTKENPYELSTN